MRLFFYMLIIAPIITWGQTSESIQGLPKNVNARTLPTVEELLGAPFSHEVALNKSNTDNQSESTNYFSPIAHQVETPSISITEKEQHFSIRDTKSATNELLGFELREGVGSTNFIPYVPDSRERTKWGVDLNPDNTIYKQQIAARKRQYYLGIAAKIAIGVGIAIGLFLFMRIVKTAK